MDEGLTVMPEQELVKDRSLTQLDMPVGDILRIQAAEVSAGRLV